MSFFSSARKKLPAEITSYDLLKFFAVVTMLIDHIGAHLLPGEPSWWRIVGRLSAPVWLFLIGYARSRELPPAFLAGAIVLVVTSITTGGHILPLNILLLFILTRLFIDRLAVYALSGRVRFLLVLVLLWIAAPFTDFLVDYGTIGIIVALWGYVARQREMGRPMKSEKIFAAFACFSYFALCFVGFKQSAVQLQFLAVALPAIFYVLYRFRPVVFDPGFVPEIIKPLLRFAGRYTLEIYVGHLVLFQLMAALYQIHGRGFFQWHWSSL